MNVDYLKDDQHYFDLYDLHTIEECLHYYWAIRNKMDANRNDLKDMTDEEFKKETHKALSYMVNAIKIERFRHRAERIGEWMDRDQKIQDVYDSAEPPENVRCPHCASDATLTSKDLFDAYDPHPYVIFMFECVKCHKRQALHSDGRPWVHEPLKCPKCGESLKSSMTKKGKVLTTTYRCPSCSYRKKEVDDFAKQQKEWDAKKKRDTELLKKYRSEFCYSEKDGQEAVQSMDLLKHAVDEMKKQEAKQADPVYQKAMKLKKISIVEMEKLIVDAVSHQKYIRFTLGQPAIGRFVEVPFTAQDTDTGRKEYDSRNQLRKLIIKALEGTNWRLMSDGISGRLGVLSGRLKGMESQEDLFDAVKK